MLHRAVVDLSAVNKPLLLRITDIETYFISYLRVGYAQIYVDLTDHSYGTVLDYKLQKSRFMNTLAIILYIL